MKNNKEDYVWVEEFNKILDAGPGWELIEVVYRDDVEQHSKDNIVPNQYGGGGYSHESTQVPLVVRRASFLMGMRADGTIEELNRRAKAAEAEVAKLTADAETKHREFLVLEKKSIQQAQEIEHCKKSREILEGDNRQLNTEVNTGRRQLSALRTAIGVLEFDRITKVEAKS